MANDPARRATFAGHSATNTFAQPDVPRVDCRRATSGGKPLSEDDYIALRPVEWRTIQAYGINLNALTYDDDALHPLRGRSSGISGHAKGRWEVRYDPYNLRQIWVRDHRADRWITVNWTLAALNEQPFSREVLRAARANLGAVAPRANHGVDLLEQITRIQNERAALQKRQSGGGGHTLPAPHGEPALQIIGDAMKEAQDSFSEEVLDSADRLKILE